MLVPPSPPSRPVRGRLAAVLVAVTATATACGVTHVNAPLLTVVTAVYPLAQAVADVGAGQVRVVDLARSGVDPRTMVLSPAEIREVHDASLVVDVGGGFQPSVESAAGGAAHVLTLLPAVGGTNPYLWLDPHLMERVGALLQRALTRREPAAEAVFRDGEEVLASELQSVDIDYQNSLSDCPDKTLVTADDAFARLTDQYGLVDRAVGTGTNPPAATVRAAAAAITTSRSNTAFTEPFVASTTVTAAAEVAGVKVRLLNTLTTPPASGAPQTVTYSNLMEQNLSAISGALRCAAVGQN